VSTNHDRAIVLVCGPDGTVQRVVRDDLGLGLRVYAGSALSEMVDAGAREKLGGFLAE
jgi:hypothetical protein